jgi:hypothetical protein
MQTGVGAHVLKLIATPKAGRMITSTIHVLILVPCVFCANEGARVASREVLQGLRLRMFAHWGHQLPRLTLLGGACHRCPRAHCHLSGIALFLYRCDKHLPPLRAASERSSRKVNFRFFAHTGHQEPAQTSTGAALQP